MSSKMNETGRAKGPGNDVIQQLMNELMSKYGITGAEVAAGRPSRCKDTKCGHHNLPIFNSSVKRPQIRFHSDIKYVIDRSSIQNIANPMASLIDFSEIVNQDLAPHFFHGTILKTSDSPSEATVKTLLVEKVAKIEGTLISAITDPTLDDIITYVKLKNDLIQQNLAVGNDCEPRVIELKNNALKAKHKRNITNLINKFFQSNQGLEGITGILNLLNTYKATLPYDDKDVQAFFDAWLEKYDQNSQNSTKDWGNKIIFPLKNSHCSHKLIQHIEAVALKRAVDNMLSSMLETDTIDNGKIDNILREHPYIARSSLIDYLVTEHLNQTEDSIRLIHSSPKTEFDRLPNEWQAQLIDVLKQSEYIQDLLSKNPADPAVILRNALQEEYFTKKLFSTGTSILIEVSCWIANLNDEDKQVSSEQANRLLELLDGWLSQSSVTEDDLYGILDNCPPHWQKPLLSTFLASDSSAKLTFSAQKYVAWMSKPNHPASASGYDKRKHELACIFLEHKQSNTEVKLAKNNLEVVLKALGMNKPFLDSTTLVLRTQLVIKHIGSLKSAGWEHKNDSESKYVTALINKAGLILNQRRLIARAIDGSDHHWGGVKSDGGTFAEFVALSKDPFDQNKSEQVKDILLLGEPSMLPDYSHLLHRLKSENTFQLRQARLVMAANWIWGGDGDCVYSNVNAVIDAFSEASFVPIRRRARPWRSSDYSLAEPEEVKEFLKDVFKQRRAEDAMPSELQNSLSEKSEPVQQPAEPKPKPAQSKAGHTRARPIVDSIPTASQEPLNPYVLNNLPSVPWPVATRIVSKDKDKKSKEPVLS